MEDETNKNILIENKYNQTYIIISFDLNILLSSKYCQYYIVEISNSIFFKKNLQAHLRGALCNMLCVSTASCFWY